MYGFCFLHEEQYVRLAFNEAVQEGMCSHEAPPCFPGHQEWREYVVVTVASHKQGDAGKRLNYCRDCTPQHKNRMMAKDACPHPETVFIHAKKWSGEMVGVRIDPHTSRTQVWEAAVMGMSGAIVQLPPTEVIERMLTKISRAAAPKKRGPRFKKDRE